MEGKSDVRVGIVRGVKIILKYSTLIAIVVLCFMVLLPFGNAILSSVVFAVVLYPYYQKLNKMIGQKPRISGSIILIVGLVVILVPGILFFFPMAEGARVMETHVGVNGLLLPLPSESITQWPIIGRKIYELLSRASINLESLLLKHQSLAIWLIQIVLSRFANMGESIIQFAFAMTLAGFLLVKSGIADHIKKYFRKLLGDNSDEYVILVSQTIRNVTIEVFVLAIIQSIFFGIGFLLAGIPNAGIWFMCVFSLIILQIPAILYSIPIIFYLFTVNTMAIAILWMIYFLIVGISGLFLRSYMVGARKSKHTAIIFIGVTIGFLLSGIIGMFTGAIIFSLGFKLMSFKFQEIV